MLGHRLWLIALIAQSFAVGCLGGAGALAPCDPLAVESAICGLMNPEDIGFLPDPSWVIVSEMAPNERDGAEEDGASAHGRLTAVRLTDSVRLALFPNATKEDSEGSAADRATSDAATGLWGDASCPGEPDRSVFRPHGIDVGYGPAGRPAIAVVNHGGREAVEFFEILSGEVPSLAWRGCVPMPSGISTNDVAFLPSGGFVVTKFMPAVEGVGLKAIWTMLKIGAGARTGSVLKWEPGRPIEEIENSEGSAPNGIAASADGSEIYVAEWGGESVYRLRLMDQGPPLRDEVELDHNPDNMTWMRDGRLLVTGQVGGVSAAMGCASVENAGCDIGYSVYVVAPGALEATKLFEGRGAASVALEVAEEIFVGFYIGDQIERLQRSD